MITVSALLLALGPLLPAVVRGVESLFGKGTGPTKLKVVETAVLPAIEALSTAGRLPGIPDAEIIRQAIEVSLKGLKATGEIDGDVQALAGKVTTSVVSAVADVVTAVMKLLQVTMAAR